MGLTLPTSRTYTLDVQRVAVLADGALHRHGGLTTSPSRSLTLSSRHLLSPQLAARWCPGLARGALSARPSAQTALFRAAGPQAEACGPRRNPPPQPGGGLLERVCPVGPFSIVPRRLAGDLVPRLPGGDVTEKRNLRDVGAAGRASLRGVFCRVVLNKWVCGGNLEPKHLVTA